MHFPFLITCHGRKEEPLIMLRAHPILLLGGGLLFVFLFALPFIVPFLAPELVTLLSESLVLGPLTVLGVSFYALVILLLGYLHFFNWFFDIWVVTNERIIDVDQEGVFSKKIGELALHNVQDVVAEKKGVFATIFDFGKITVETAGAKEEFSFSGLPDPDGVAKKILELARKDAPFHQGLAQTQTPHP